MKKYIRKIIPNRLIESYKSLLNIKDWRARGYLGNSPQFIKQSVFIKYGISGAKWVETGTYLGTTTRFLSKISPHVYSIEPSKELYNKALERFKGFNVTLFNDVSENSLYELLPTLNGDINFWLDGHYSAGITFKGKTDCPVEHELKAIETNLTNFTKLTILIDDVRCFLPTTKNEDYPSIDYLVDWARRNKMSWTIEHDIFIIQKA